MSPTTEKLMRAVSYAALKHREQTRKDGKTPYVAHTFRVTLVLRSLFGVEDEDVLTAAVLHDTIEDTTADRDDLIERFGARVAEIVATLSKDKRLPEEERESVYMDTLASASWEVQVCKLADTLDNLVDSAGLRAHARQKTIRKAREVLSRFEPTLPERWRGAADLVRAEIENAEAAAAREAAR